MDKKFLIVSVFLMAGGVMGFASAKSYYVSVDGNDNNIGSLQMPFKTISKAASVARAGDTCYIMEGVYREILSPSYSGTKKNPIVFKNYKDDNVVVDATELINGWTIYKDNIYKAKRKLGFDIVGNTLYYNDRIMDVARWPDNVDGDRLTFEAHRISGGSGESMIVEDVPFDNLSDGYFCYMGAHSGMTWSRKINKHVSDTIMFDAVDIKKWPFNPHNPTVLRNKNRGQVYFYGSKQLLDFQNEWYYDESSETVYAIFPDYVSPAENSVKVGERKYTMTIDIDYIKVEGLRFFGGMARISGNNCKIENCVFSNCSQSLDVLNNRGAQSSNGAIVLEGKNICVEKNLLEYGSANGIVMLASRKGGMNYRIHDNIIRYFNTLGLHSGPIRSNCDNTVITNNTIYSCGRDGIYVSGRNCEIAYNDVSDCMRINNDGGVFYTVGNAELKNTEIHHNWFHDSYGPSYADGRAAGIYLDNNSKGYNVHHNVVWNITWGALQFNWYNTDINFYNNSIWNVGYATGRWANGHTMERISIVNNYSNVLSRDSVEWVGTDIMSNCIDAKCPFKSVEEKDFTLLAGSVLINGGIYVKGLKIQKKGNKADLGAYESGLEPWKAGASWSVK